MISWYYMLGAAGLLLVFLFYKEWTRKKRSARYARLLASAVAVTSLVAIAWPGAKSDAPSEKKIIIATAGFVKDSLDNFLQQNNKRTPVFSTNLAGEYIHAGNSSALITDWTVFVQHHKEDTMHVFGNGFSNEVLGLLQGHPIVFHTPPPASTITHIYWNQYLHAGEPLTIQGSYENSTAKKIKLVLQSFGKDKDSVFINPHSNQDFTLQTIPVYTGRSVFSIIAMAGNDTLQNEPIPAEVQPSLPLQLLIISSSPDFENTYLKNHLSQKGYQVAITTAISSNKKDKQFLNMPGQQGGIASSYLNKFDVLMADEEALQKMGTAELAAIRSAIQDNGTGLVIKLDAEKNKTAFYSKFFPVKKLQQDKQSYIQLRESNTDSSKYKIAITEPVVISYQPGTQILLQDEQSAIYAAGTIEGTGKIVATTLQNTYSIALSGNTASYQQLWWLLLHKAAKKTVAEENWQVSPFINFANSPVVLQAEKNDAVPHAVLHQTNIYLKQNALLPFQWKGMYWPASNGWQPFPRANTSTGNWYVYKTGDWQKLQDYKRLRATKKYATAHPLSIKEQAADTASSYWLNKSLFLFITFLASCIFLWVEQKRG